MRPDEGVLVSYENNNWLVTETGRHDIDLSDRALTSAVGIPVTSKATPISEGLFNALPNAGPWRLPDIPRFGEPNTVGLPPNLVIGAVFKALTEDGEQHFVVLPDGVARINGTTAAALRATNSFGLISPPSVEASVVARIAEQVFASPLPDEPLEILLREDAPTLCWAWQREPGDQAPKTTVITGRHLPIAPSALTTGIDQIGGDATVYIDGGKYIRLQSPDPRYGESLYYIDPQGVRYGLPDEKTGGTLGLNAPVTAPWQVVSLLVDGPVLSKQAALVEHDTLPADPNPRKIADGNAAQTRDGQHRRRRMTTKKFTPIIKRGPRLTPGEINVTPPDDLGVEIPPSGIQKALPWVMGGGMLGMIVIMIFTGIRQLSPYMLMMPLMMVMATVGFMAGGGPGGKRVPEINADRKEYLRYLAGLRTRVTSSAAAQVTFFNYHAPHPDDLLSIIGTNRQWSRPANADFYAAVRIGLGAEPAVDRLLKPAVGGELAGPQGAPQPHLEPVSHMWVTKFLRTHGLIHDCPKLVQLRTFPTIAVGGEPDGAAGLLTAMICHLAVFHPPDLLQIRVLTDNPEDPNWAWLKWLPHVQHQTDTDAAGPTRLVFTRPDGLSDLTARGPHTPDATPSGPYVVVIDLSGGKAGFPVDGRAGVTVITLGNHRGSAYRIRVDADGTADDRLPNQTFRLVTSVSDRMSPEQATRVARKLAGWSITGTIIDKSVRVQKKVATEWHQLVGAQAIEEVTPSRWRMFTDTDRDRLRIPFGHELKTGDIMYLDIKEGAEFGAGPHGMLIGTTGSGKSEFLRTLILSLAATHHPDQVNLLLTDFKGGSTFLGMEKLPHTAAVVTNMEEEAELVSRMGEVLTGELDRRQSILRQAGIQVGAAGALSGVAEYEKHRERGADLPPLPTLFVVVDEFAELLQNHPDFIALFDRICRVGRSLRVHLLLATQSLNTGGVRIDKLEPNLTYRIALRTTSSAESKAVIGTPEAQYITNKESGVGFLRVGMEDPVKFHSVYTGVNYVPTAPVQEDGEVKPRSQGPDGLRIHQFTAAPIFDTAVTS